MSANDTVAGSAPDVTSQRSVCSVSCSEVMPEVVSMRRISSDGCRRAGVTRGRGAEATGGGPSSCPTETAGGIRSAAKFPHAVASRTCRARAAAQWASARGPSTAGPASGSTKRKWWGAPGHPLPAPRVRCAICRSPAAGLGRRTIRWPPSRRGEPVVTAAVGIDPGRPGAARDRCAPSMRTLTPCGHSMAPSQPSPALPVAATSVSNPSLTSRATTVTGRSSG